MHLVLAYNEMLTFLAFSLPIYCVSFADSYEIYFKNSIFRFDCSIIKAIIDLNDKSLREMNEEFDDIEKQINTSETYDDERLSLEENILKQKVRIFITSLLYLVSFLDNFLTQVNNYSIVHVVVLWHHRGGVNELSEGNCIGDLIGDRCKVGL